MNDELEVKKNNKKKLIIIIPISLTIIALLVFLGIKNAGAFQMEK